MKKAVASFIFNRLMGWKLRGEFPDHKKMVIIVVPHTSWHDFYIGLLVRAISGVSINYVGKKELFTSPLGWFFRWTGGAPIDRGKSSNTVDAVVDIFNSRKEFRLTIAPEGTRKAVTTWKTGFYYIALGAKVPIVPVAFDFGNKEVRIAPPFYPSGSLEVDLPKLYAYFDGVEGKKPENSFRVSRDT